MLWTWIAAGGALLLLFICSGGFFLWWGHTYDEDVGNPPFKGSTAKLDAESFDVTAGGRDIWDESDQFHFYARRIIGDFDLEVRVAKIESSGQVNQSGQIDPWVKAGLMARDSLNADSTHVSVFATPKSGYCLQRRTAKGARSSTFPQDASKATPCSFPSAWLRLQRVGDEFTAYTSVDGRVWNTLNKAKIPDFPSIAYVGLAVTAHDLRRTARAEFRNFANH
jgi:hypothetical protein